MEKTVNRKKGEKDDFNENYLPYKNLNPANPEYHAILAGKRGISLGFLSFKNAKTCSPFKKFLFKKFDRQDPVS